MRGLNDRKFLNLFQIVHRASCPDPTNSHWRVGEVDWRKDRHTFSGAGYAFSTEVHQLRRAAGGSDWALMVVTEYWWDTRREVLRSTTWAKALEGSAPVIAAWFRDHDKDRPARPQ